MRNKEILSWGCVALAVSAWGVTFASTRFLLVDFSPLEILVLRFSIAFAALWTVGRFTGKADWGGWRNEWIFAGMGLSGIVAYQFLENCAISVMNASSVAIVVAFGPLVTAILARALTADGQFSARFGSGSLMAIAGVAIVGFEGVHVFSFSLMGMFLAITAMFSWAVYSVLLELANERGVPPLTAVCRAFGWSLATLAPLVAWKSVQSCAQGQGCPAAVVLDAAANAARFGKLANLLNIVFLGLVASAASFVLWSAACRDLGVVRVTAALYLTPIAGVVFAAVFLGEKVTGLEILGGAAILVGVATATFDHGGSFLKGRKGQGEEDEHSPRKQL